MYFSSVYDEQIVPYINNSYFASVGDEKNVKCINNSYFAFVGHEQNVPFINNSYFSSVGDEQIVPSINNSYFAFVGDEQNVRTKWHARPGLACLQHPEGQGPRPPPLQRLEEDLPDEESEDFHRFQ